MADEESWLLELSDPCLLAVLQQTADNPHRLFSAARAHSKLREADGLALRSISVAKLEQQQQVDSLLLYLAKHGQHVDSITIEGDVEVAGAQWWSSVSILQLPSTMQISSLQLTSFPVQLRPGYSSQGLLGPAARAGGSTLKQLRLADCVVVDGQAGLAAALAQLPGLEHLSVRNPLCRRYLAPAGAYPLEPMLAGVLLQLPHLTYLELYSVPGMQAPGVGQPYLQGLQLLTHLLDLRLVPYWDMQQHVTASMLSDAHQLTRLQFSSYTFETCALAGKATLQHLDLHSCSVTAGAAAVPPAAHAVADIPGPQRLHVQSA